MASLPSTRFGAEPGGWGPAGYWGEGEEMEVEPEPPSWEEGGESIVGGSPTATPTCPGGSGAVGSSGILLNPPGPGGCLEVL